MVNFIRLILYPFRKFLTKLLILDDKIAPWANPNYLEFSPMPIDMASNFVVSQEVEGDYLEFGVYQGSSFIKAYKSINHVEKEWDNIERTKNVYNNLEVGKKSFKKSKKYKTHFYAFDSFEGLPTIDTLDQGDARFDEGRYYCSKENFIKNLLREKIDMKKITITKGFYKDSLNEKLKKEINLEKAAIIFIDCDLYTSTRSVLNFITNLISNGTIIIFDDWFTYKGNPNKGEQKACREWLEFNKNISLISYKSFHAFQMSFIVNISIE